MAKTLERTVHGVALQVLKDVGIPLTAQQIYEKIQEKGLYSFNSADPVTIVRGAIRRRCADLDFDSAERVKYFKLVNPNRYTPLEAHTSPTEEDTAPAGEMHPPVPTTTISQLREAHDRHLDELREELLQVLHRLEPEQFEVFAKHLLTACGFVETHATPKGRDGGIDGYGKLKVGLGTLDVAFQCKRWKRNVGRPQINEFRGTIQGKYSQGYLFTTGAFARGVAEEEQRPGAVPILLYDGPQIVELMIKHRLGVEVAEELTVYRQAVDLLFDEEA